MTTPKILNLVGRIGVAFYFLWSVPFSFGARGHHLSEFRRVGAPNGALLFWIGIAIATIGSLLFLNTPMAMTGGLLLIVFTLTSDALFPRCWTYSDPDEMVMHKFSLFEHVALCGGILGRGTATL